MHNLTAALVHSVCFIVSCVLQVSCNLLCCHTTQSFSVKGDRQEPPKGSIGSSTERSSRRERLGRRRVVWAARCAGRAR